jgi:hypothetical protein
MLIITSEMHPLLDVSLRQKSIRGGNSSLGVGRIKVDLDCGVEGIRYVLDVRGLDRCEGG